MRSWVCLLRFFASQLFQQEGSIKISDSGQSINRTFVRNLAMGWNANVEKMRLLDSHPGKRINM